MDMIYTFVCVLHVRHIENCAILYCFSLYFQSCMYSPLMLLKHHCLGYASIIMYHHHASFIRLEFFLLEIQLQFWEGKIIKGKETLNSVLIEEEIFLL